MSRWPLMPRAIATLARNGQWSEVRWAISDFFAEARLNGWRCFFRLHTYEFYSRPNWARDDLDEGWSCVRCDKEGEPQSWRYWSRLWDTRLGQWWIEREYRRWLKENLDAD
jgi:hypothetical protein